jgi:hypothetical protein
MPQRSVAEGRNFINSREARIGDPFAISRVAGCESFWRTKFMIERR